MNADLSCRQCRDALAELTAGILCSADRQTAERHLATCPDCRRERDAWGALGDAIRERGRQVPTDGGFGAGLLRLRATVALEDHEDFEKLETEESSMARDPQLTDRPVPTTLHDNERPANSGGSKRRPYGAFGAAAAIVLLSALLFGGLATRLHSGPGTLGSMPPTPTPTSAATGAATPTAASLPAGANVVSISMVSASDGWAVATYNSDAWLLHYDGSRWAPAGNTYAGTYLTDISMDSRDDWWAVGARSDQVTGVVLHYSAGRWSQVEAPTIHFAGARVWAFSPSDALVLATLPKDQTGNLGSALLHYHNGAWTETASPCGISGMALLSSDDLWASCFDDRILHYQAGRWTTYSIGGQAAQQGGQPLAISMVSDNEGWVTGFSNAVPQGMFLAHFDGQAWTRVQGPPASGPTNMNSIVMVSSNEGWAGGDLMDSTGALKAVLLHYVNGTWETVPAPYSGGIGKIVMVSPAEGWAAVGGGADAGLLHYQNGRWTPYTPGA